MHCHVYACTQHRLSSHACQFYWREVGQLKVIEASQHSIIFFLWVTCTEIFKLKLLIFVICFLLLLSNSLKNLLKHLSPKVYCGVAINPIILIVHSSNLFSWSEWKYLFHAKCKKSLNYKFTKIFVILDYLCTCQIRHFIRWLWLGVSCFSNLNIKWYAFWKLKSMETIF
jgi:hypothetical protein